MFDVELTRLECLRLAQERSRTEHRTGAHQAYGDPIEILATARRYLEFVTSGETGPAAGTLAEFESKRDVTAWLR